MQKEFNAIFTGPSDPITLTFISIEEATTYYDTNYYKYDDCWWFFEQNHSYQIGRTSANWSFGVEDNGITGNLDEYHGGWYPYVYTNSTYSGDGRNYNLTLKFQINGGDGRYNIITYNNIDNTSYANNNIELYYDSSKALTVYQKYCYADLTAEVSNNILTVSFIGDLGDYDGRINGETIPLKTIYITSGGSTAFVYFYNYDYMCFTEDTLVTLADNTQKQAKDITYEDELLAFNFDDGYLDTAKIAWLSKPMKANNYYKVELSNGTILKLVGTKGKSHRLFNIERGKFIYPQDFKENEHTMTEKGEWVNVVSIENIEEEVTYYNLMTAYKLNYYLNGICSGSRLSNLYPIEGYQYIKKKRESISEFKSLPSHYIEELRLLEQPDQDEESIKYADTLEEHIYNVYYKNDVRYKEK